VAVVVRLVIAQALQLLVVALVVDQQSILALTVNHLLGLEALVEETVELILVAAVAVALSSMLHIWQGVFLVAAALAS
jgi:hypothetical protein